MDYVWDDEPCPGRGLGLKHTMGVAPGSACQDCGMPTYRVATRKVWEFLRKRHVEDRQVELDGASHYGMCIRCPGLPAHPVHP